MESPDLEAARRYLRDLYGPQEHAALFLWNASGQIEQRVHPLPIILAPRFLAYLGRRNEEGFNISVSMNPVVGPPRFGRTLEEITEVRRLYLDLDAGGRNAVNSLLASDKAPRPNYVLETSPGHFHTIWQVQGISKDHASEYLRGLAKEFGGDPAATDIARVLRVPGFLNRKYPEAPRVRLHRHSHLVYGPESFRTERIADPVVFRASLPADQRSLTKDSRSEHEWGWTMHQLEPRSKGGLNRDPDEVRRELAAMAAQRGKHQGRQRAVESYARRTVDKALNRIHSQGYER